MFGYRCPPAATRSTACMPNKPSWRCLSLGIGAFVAIAVVVWGVRKHFAPPPAVVYRADLVLREGALFRPDAAQPFSGLLVEEWKAGVRRAEVTIREGRANGLSRGWFENGELEVEETFANGVSDGLRTRWHETGAKKSQVKIRGGQLTGVFREWHANGSLARETPLRDGVPHGEARSWDAEGNLTGTARVAHGKLVSRN